MKIILTIPAREWFRIKKDPEHHGWDKLRNALAGIYPNGLEIEDVNVQYRADTVRIIVKGRESLNPLRMFWPTLAVGRLNSRYLNKVQT